MFYAVADGHGLAHDPFKALVVPRPIGWISTLSAEYGPNLAPFSFFNAVSAAPPVVMFAANGAHRDGGPKDSALNAERGGEFVCNLATWDLREAMNASAAMLGRGENEFSVAGLTAAPSRLVAPPRVAQSPVNLECRYLRTVDLPSRDPAERNAAVFGEVVAIHIDDSLLHDGRVDVAAMRPLARLGYMEYAVIDRVFSMPRP